MVVLLREIRLMEAICYFNRPKLLVENDIQDELIQYLKKNGLKSSKWLYEDSIESNAQRSKLVSELSANQRGIIVVYGLHFWSRSIQDLFSSLTQLKKTSVQLIAIRDNFELTNPTSAMILSVLELVINFERTMRSDRIALGMHQVKSTGRCLGRPNKIANHKQQILKLYDQGYRKSQIAKTLGLSRTSVSRLLSQEAFLDTSSES
jgi:DNA invertase Pin-like site-specific DNA recombinase